MILNEAIYNEAAKWMYSLDGSALASLESAGGRWGSSDVDDKERHNTHLKNAIYCLEASLDSVYPLLFEFYVRYRR